ncbi:hypothetical protein GCM10027187_09560 [Streptosporangium sandarakinum]
MVPPYGSPSAGDAPYGGAACPGRGAAQTLSSVSRASHRSPPPEGRAPMYKEFAIEAIVWLIPVVILIGLAYMITRPA